MTDAPAAMAASADPAPRAVGDQPTDLGFALFLLAALPLCWVPAAPMAGLEIALAPFFYLIAGHRWGFRHGLLAAVVLSMPSLWWWEHPFRMVLAIGHYLFVQYYRQRGLLFAESTALYNLVLGPVAATVIVVLWYDAPPLISVVVFLKNTISEILLAATCDVIVLNFRMRRGYPFVAPRRHRSLDKLLRTMINFVIILLFAATMANESQALDSLEDGYRLQVREAAGTIVDRQAGSASLGASAGLLLSDGSRAHMFVSNDDAGFRARAQAALGRACQRFTDLGGERRQGFDYWVSVCETVPFTDNGRAFRVATSFRDSAIQAYLHISLRMMALLAVAMFALLYRISMTRSLRETLEACNAIVGQFGTPSLPAPPSLPFKEVDRPMRQFVARNNNYVAAIEDRDRLLGVARDLKRSIDLRLMSDIRFVPETGRLSFIEVRLSEVPIMEELQVHASDCPLFVEATGSDEAIIEFRTAQGEDFESLILTLRQSVGPCQWASGMIVKLWQPKRLREIMTRQARLVDLGGMASAISHEIKQPLFTIAIAAESVHLLLGKPAGAERDAQLAARATRIGDQVERAREIIDRISLYGRVDSLESSSTDVAAALHAARSFLAALLHDRGIAVTIDIGPGAHIVDMPRIALEQVLVNAIQNAADAIESRREAGPCDAGNIGLAVTIVTGQIICSVTDDGTGLKAGLADTAFEAFFTTKPATKGTGLGLFISRQIVMEAGGDIRLLPARPVGARLEIVLPLRAG